MSESRSYGYTPSYSNTSSESRNNSGESRNYSYERECHVDERPNSVKKTTTKKEIAPQYNSLETIDKLIEDLESTIPTNSSNSQRINQAIDKRRSQIEELKQLREEAIKQANDEKIAISLEQENEQYDSQIEDLRKLVLKPRSK